MDELVPLSYERSQPEDLPAHVRAASALRRFANRLVIVQDDVDALAVRDSSGAVSPVLLPAHGSGRRVFDDTVGNKSEKMDLEACVVLPDGRLVAFGSGSTPVREQFVVWNGRDAPVKRSASDFYAQLRSVVTRSEMRLNVEGVVASDGRLMLFHRGNDVRPADGTSANGIAELELKEFVNWLDGRDRLPRIGRVTHADLGDVEGVPFTFTDAVAVDAGRVVVLACAEDSTGAITDGAVLGCRVGVLGNGMLRTADVYEATGERTLLKLEGIERRPGERFEFDVAVDVDRPWSAAQLGRLVWEWHS